MCSIEQQKSAVQGTASIPAPRTGTSWSILVVNRTMCGSYLWKTISASLCPWIFNHDHRQTQTVVGDKGNDKDIFGLFLKWMKLQVQKTISTFSYPWFWPWLKCIKLTKIPHCILVTVKIKDTRMSILFFCTCNFIHFKKRPKISLSFPLSPTTVWVWRWSWLKIKVTREWWGTFSSLPEVKSEHLWWVTAQNFFWHFRVLNMILTKTWDGDRGTDEEHSG